MAESPIKRRAILRFNADADAKTKAIDIIKNAGNLNPVLRGLSVTPCKEGIEIVSEGLTKELANDLAEKARKSQKYDRHCSIRIVLYEDVRTGGCDKNSVAPSADFQRNYEKMAASKSALEIQVNSLTMQIATLQNAYESTTKKLNESENTVHSLEAQLAETRSQAGEANKKMRQTSSIYDAVIPHLLQFSDTTLNGLEEILSQYAAEEEKNQKVDLEKVRAYLKDMDLPAEGQKVEKLKVLLYWLVEDNIRENIFDKKNPERFIEYTEAQKTIDGEQETRKGLAQLPMGEAGKAAITKAFEDDLAKNRAVKDSYEAERAAFSKKILEEISEMDNQLEKAKEQAEKMAAIAGKGSGKIPVYVRLRSEGDNHFVEVYRPQKANQSAASIDRVLSCQILNEKVCGLLDQETLDKMGDEGDKVDEASGLRFWQITLPKAKYSPGRISAIRNSIESAIQGGYSRTGFDKLGIGVDLVVNYDVDSVQEEPKREPNAEISEKPKLTEAMLLNAIGRSNPLSLSEICRNANVSTHGSEGYQVGKLLKKAVKNGTVVSSGKGAGTRYSCKPGQ